MESTELTKWRGEVIKNFINIEVFIEAIISKHYIGDIKFNFIFEVLKDPNFIFGMKRRILEKIIGAENTPEIQTLNKLNKIRNIFAHWGVQILCVDNSVYTPNQKNLNVPQDFKELYDDFMKGVDVVEPYLYNLLKAKGVNIGIDSKKHFDSKKGPKGYIEIKKV